MALLPLFYVFLSGLGFSIQSLFLKLISQDGSKLAFEFVFYRGLFQILLSSIVMYHHRDNDVAIFGNNRKVLGIMFLRSVVGYGGIAFAFLAVERLPIGDATVLTMLAPFVAGIAAICMLGEEWQLQDFIATLIALVGMVLIAKPSFLFGGEANDLLGVIYGLLASLSAGFAFIYVRMLGVLKVPWENVCFSQGLAQVVMSIPSMYIARQQFTYEMTHMDALYIVFGGIIGSFSQVAMTVGMQREKSATASAMRMSDVIFSFLMEFFFTQDSISFLSLFGATLVTSSVLLIVYFKRRSDNIEEKAKMTPRSSMKDSTDDDDISSEKESYINQRWQTILNNPLNRDIEMSDRKSATHQDINISYKPLPNNSNSDV